MFNQLFRLAVVGALLLNGCALTGMREPAPLKNLGIAAEGAEVKVEVVDVIQPGDPSSWVDQARWTEVVVRVSSRSAKQLSVQGGRLIDHQGVVLTQLTNVLAEQDINQQLAKVQTAQMGYGAATQAATQIAGYGMGYGSGLGAVPYVGAILQLAMSVGHQYAAKSIADEPKKISAEAQRRSLPRGVTLAQGGATEGSLFFRYTPSPQKVVVDYAVEGQPGTLEIALGQSVTAAYASVETARAKTDQVEVMLGTDPSSRPVLVGSRLQKVNLGFSRPLSELEFKNLRVGFLPAEFPCAKAGSLEVSGDRKSATLSKFPEGCLRGAKGPFDLVVAGLNVNTKAFFFSGPEAAQMAAATPVPAAQVQTVAVAVAQPATSLSAPPVPSTSAVSNPIVEVIANEARVREEPRADSKLVRAVPKGTRLEKLEEAPKWTKVLVDGEHAGWVPSSVVKQIAATPAAPMVGDRTYVFQAGDSLSDVAMRLTGSAENWKRIAEYNGITDPAQLRPGKEIKIPPSLVGKPPR